MLYLCIVSNSKLMLYVSVFENWTIRNIIEKLKILKKFSSRLKDCFIGKIRVNSLKQSAEFLRLNNAIVRETLE